MTGNKKQRQKGFTLIELVVVIAILAILASFALPRFAALSEQAHRASIQGTAGALSAGVALVKAQWVTNGSTGLVASVDGFGDFAAGSGVAANANGWPDPTQGDGCANLWNKLLQSNAPEVAADGAAVGNAEYQASWDGSTCTYTYLPDDRNSTIEYTPDTGAIEKTIN